MRAGQANTVTGLVVMAIPDEITTAEREFIADDDGFIVVHLVIDSASVKSTVVFDMGTSGVEGAVSAHTAACRPGDALLLRGVRQPSELSSRASSS